MRPHLQSQENDKVASKATSRFKKTSTFLPKLPSREMSALSAKNLWRNHLSVDTHTAVERLNAPDVPPIRVAKNPKPLYRRRVADTKPFRILHSDSDYRCKNKSNLAGLYAEMTFLTNAVRNIDGITSYKGLCKVRTTSKTIPSSAPGRLEDPQNLHWSSASNDKPALRMLLPTSPGCNTKWFAWKTAPPREILSVRPEQMCANVLYSGLDSGIESRASFLHSVARKRGQIVVTYEHNGRQHHTLVKPCELAISQDDDRRTEKGRRTDTGSSCGTESSSSSVTHSRNSNGNLSMKGLDEGGRNNGDHSVHSISSLMDHLAKDAKAITSVEEVENTCKDSLNNRFHKKEYKKSQDTLDHVDRESQENNAREKSSTVTETWNREVHFADDATTNDGIITPVAKDDHCISPVLETFLKTMDIMDDGTDRTLFADAPAINDDAVSAENDRNQTSYTTENPDKPVNDITDDGVDRMNYSDDVSHYAITGATDDNQAETVPEHTITITDIHIHKTDKINTDDGPIANDNAEHDIKHTSYTLDTAIKDDE